jgi:outer membrane receptor protein involved in Fe transport
MAASGTLQRLDTSSTQTFSTDSRGLVTFGALPPGRYRVEVSREGFATESLLVDVQAGAVTSRIVSLAIGPTVTSVDVVATTPLVGSDLAIRDVPAPVQTATKQDLENSGSLDLADLMNRRLSGVNVNANQENPFQPDVNYRGYTASPLLGTPQGVSVYLDGVRLNQPFGDVVSWDLIPRVAISDIALIPGSNPLFGLNTLGGALSIGTKDGRSQPGTTVSVTGGSFARRAVEFEHGGSQANGFNWYFAGHLFHEDGWRVASPSDVRQLFAKLGWQSARTSMALSVAYADNSLTGNGLQEQRLLARDYRSAYTLGDVTTNRSPALTLSARHAATDAITISGNVYLRHIRTDAVNPNLNTESLSESVYQPTAADQTALTAAGYKGFPTAGATAANTPFPSWRCIAQALQQSEPVEKCNGIITRTSTRQTNYGASGQLTWTTARTGLRNQLANGLALDRSSLSFVQSTQFGYVNPDYTLTAVNAFEDGTTNQNGQPLDTRVALDGTPHTWSIYGTDTLSVGPRWTFTLSGRFNRTMIENVDRLTPSGTPGSLDGRDTFGRLNPAAGAIFRPAQHMSLYANVSESSRAPTSIELGCADPANPCNLPNALAGDPPLDQVVTRTVEAGARGDYSGITWSAGWFRANTDHDILFVASPQTGNGYFKNFGRTRRQGLELHVSARVQRVTLGGNYTLVDATYQSPETVDGSSNSTNDSASVGAPGLDGVIQILPGDRIPLIPRHIVKVFGDIQATTKLSLDVDFSAVSSAFARGNENNASQADSTYYLGPGTSPGYSVVDAAARYQVRPHVQLFAQINNLFNRHYYTAAQLGPTGFTAQGTFIARPLPAVSGNFPIVHAAFYAPGAPFGAWGGLRLTF